MLPEYRVNTDPARSRDIDQISLPELLSAIVEAAEGCGSFDSESAPRMIASMFGFSRPGERIKTVTDQVLEIALEQGLIRTENGRFVKGGRPTVDDGATRGIRTPGLLFTRQVP